MTEAGYEKKYSLLSFYKREVNHKISIIILSVFTLAGCAGQTDFREEEIRPLPFTIPHSPGTGHHRHIDGIRKALAESPDKPVRILILHGMITDEPNYSEDIQKRIGEKLGLIRSSPEKTESIFINRGYDFTTYLGPKPYGHTPRLSELRKYVWVSPEQPDIERLIYYEVLWSPFRDQVKNGFLACFESRSVDQKDCLSFEGKRNSDSRTLGNGWLKDEILINGFADPIILLGSLGDVIKDDIMLANCIVARDVLDNTDKEIKKFEEERCDLFSYVTEESRYQSTTDALLNTPFFTITYSLGSFLYMDTEQRFSLENMRKEKGGNLNNEDLQDAQLFNLFDQRTVYMMANQVPLLQLARFTAEDCSPDNGEGECPNKLLRDRTEPVDPITARSTYVAFNDVNDLLGYDLPPYLQHTGTFGRMINFSVRNPGFSIPYLFKSPNAAHTNHANNPAVIKAIVEGIEIPKKQLAR